MDFELTHSAEMSNALLNIWPTVCQAVRNLVVSKTTFAVVSKFDDDWNIVFSLLKIFPCKSRKNVATPAFNDVISKLIVFHLVGELLAKIHWPLSLDREMTNFFFSMHAFCIFFANQIGTAPAIMLLSDNRTAFIIGVGVSPKEINQYYIKVEEHLIPVSSSDIYISITLC